MDYEGVLVQGIIDVFWLENDKIVLLKGTLWAHLTEIDQAANQQIESMMAELDLDYCKEPVSMEVQYALSNSLGFGGHNACVIFKKYAE